MNFAESLVVTIMGMGVVYIGLLLSFLTIAVIIKTPDLIKRFKGAASAVTTTVAQIAEEKPAQIEPSREVMAVIATVLEVELRLRKSVANTRYTFRKSRLQ